MRVTLPGNDTRSYTRVMASSTRKQPTSPSDEIDLASHFDDLIRTEMSEQEQVRKELEAGTDRACAVIGGVAIDNALEKLLKSIVVPGAKVPIGNVGNRCRAAFAFGLISKNEAREIQRLTEIRNKFSHVLLPDGFKNKEVRAMCNGLEYVENYYLHPSWLAYVTDRLQPPGWEKGHRVILPKPYVIYSHGRKPRERYQWAVNAILEILSARVGQRYGSTIASRVPEVASVDEVQSMRWQNLNRIFSAMRSNTQLRATEMQRDVAWLEMVDFLTRQAIRDSVYQYTHSAGPPTKKQWQQEHDSEVELD